MPAAACRDDAQRGGKLSAPEPYFGKHVDLYVFIGTIGAAFVAAIVNVICHAVRKGFPPRHGRRR